MAQAAQETARAELDALHQQRQSRFAYAAQQERVRLLNTSKTPEQVAREFRQEGGLARYQNGHLMFEPWRIQIALVADIVARELAHLDSVLCAIMGIGKTFIGLHVIYTTGKERGAQRFGHPTLVIGPKGVYHQWMIEARKFYPPELMTFDSIESSADAFERFSVERTMQCLDFVVVSYDTLKASVGSALFNVPWHRVIVDEGSFIVNESTDAFKTCASIKAQRRLFISGTPVPNARATEMNAILQFLGSDLRVPSLIPLARAMSKADDDTATADDEWMLHDADEEAADPVEDIGKTAEEVIARWRQVMERYWVVAELNADDLEAIPIAVRKLQVHQTEIDFVMPTTPEQNNYHALLRQAKMPEEQCNRLQWITWLRQACNSQTLTSRTKVKKQIVEARRKIRALERTAIKCEDTNANAIAAKARAKSAQEQRRERKKAGEAEWIADAPPLHEGDATEYYEILATAAAEIPPPLMSSKYQKMLDYEKARMMAGEKALIISETLGPLEEFQHLAREAGLTCELLSGDMTARQRVEVTERVGDPGSAEPRFILLPIRLGFGINGLQGDAEHGGGGANHVMFLDGYWNDALEMQGLARLLRPGQSREVYSIKFVTLGTIEERVLHYNQFKQELQRLVLDVNTIRRTVPGRSAT